MTINSNNSSTTGGFITWTTTGACSGGQITWIIPDINEELPIEKEHEICICKKCNEINEFAESNQDDGSFICYSCRAR